MDRRTFIKFPLVSAALPAVEKASALAAHTSGMEMPVETPERVEINFKANLPAAGTFPAKWICGSPVIFQEVVHSNRTGEAVCDEQAEIFGGNEWTFIRMPDSAIGVESVYAGL